MKKVFCLLVSLILFSACGMNTAKNSVEEYLKKYKTLDSEVLVDLENVIDSENLSEIDEDKYRDVLKKQYKDLSYEILEEEYDGDTAYVTVKISVYDLYKAAKEASDYLATNKDAFNDEDGNYSEELFTSYKLDKMKNTTEKVDYTITFTVKKENDTYVVSQPTENDLLKIHGIYNYDLN